MNDRNGLISYEQFSLSYSKFGNGPELLFAFHGFGRNSQDFKVFETELGSTYTIIAFNFFHHGENPEKVAVENFTSAVLSNILEKIMWEEKKVRCSMIGYSLGARLVLGCIHRLPHRTENIFLLAPDGFTRDLIPRFIGGTMIGRLIGRLAVNFPVLMKYAINIFGAIKVIDKKKKAFFLSEVENREKRLRVFNTWVSLKKYDTHLHLAQHYIRTRKIRFEFFFGKNDKIINPAVVNRFSKKLGGKGTVHLLNCGHSILKEHSEISRIILTGK